VNRGIGVRQKAEHAARELKKSSFIRSPVEFCFNHYVTVTFLFFTHFKLLLNDWRGYIVAAFSLVWIANFYMSAFGRFRLDIKARTNRD
jgi:hypothetical protein